LIGAWIGKSDSSTAPETVVTYLAGGIILGAVVGVAIIFSRKPTYRTPRWREPIATPRRQPLAQAARAASSTTPSPLAAPVTHPTHGSQNPPAGKQAAANQDEAKHPEGAQLGEKRAAAL
jgi:hypothetical protein